MKCGAGFHGLVSAPITWWIEVVMGPQASRFVGPTNISYYHRELQTQTILAGQVTDLESLMFYWKPQSEEKTPGSQEIVPARNSVKPPRVVFTFLFEFRLNERDTTCL